MLLCQLPMGSTGCPWAIEGDAPQQKKRLKTTRIVKQYHAACKVKAARPILPLQALPIDEVALVSHHLPGVKPPKTAARGPSSREVG